MALAARWLIALQRARRQPALAEIDKLLMMYPTRASCAACASTSSRTALATTAWHKAVEDMMSFRKTFPR
jgi:hypothetical protein